MDNKVHSGLSTEEVNLRISKSQTNRLKKSPSRSILQIVFNNLFTFFNGLNVVFVLLILSVNSPKNMFFAIIPLANIFIGIFQEIRSRRALDKLSLSNVKLSKVIRNSKEVTIDANDIVLGDLMILRGGDEVSADGEVLAANYLEVNESQISGEAISVFKKPGDSIKSGSYIISGSGEVLINKVGKDTYINMLSFEAKSFKSVPSELKRAMNSIIKKITIALVPVAIILFISQILILNQSFQTGLLVSVAGVIGMVPEGLILLTSLSFALGVINLASKRTIAQELVAVENLARTDCLCFDKTGTLTEGTMIVNSINILDNKLCDLTTIATYAINKEDESNSIKALNDYLKKTSLKGWKVLKSIPFSSEKKWSALSFDNNTTYMLSAPEIIPFSSEKKKDIESFASQGYRVLAFSKCDNISNSKDLPSNITPLAIILLEDKLRENAKETIKYLYEQGVELKIISGDNPLTVSTIARRLKVKNANKYISSNELPYDDFEKLDAMVKEYTVFGRVSPLEKKLLVQSLKRIGHTVGMTGDGVNDILALKEADCSIAMASGSPAVGSISQLVLLDSNFSSIPNIINEGRRVVNNIQMVSSIFLVKTCYSIIIALLVSLFSFSYPYTPIQIMLISTISVGIPSFLYTFQPNKMKIQPGFFNKILSIAIPGGIVISIFVIGLNSILRFTNLNLNPIETTSIIVFVTGVIQIFILFRIARPLNMWRRFINFTMLIIFVAVFYIKPISKFFTLIPINASQMFISIICITFGCLLILLGEHLILRYGRKYENQLKSTMTD